MRHLELSGGLPPEMYAYRKQFDSGWGHSSFAGSLPGGWSVATPRGLLIGMNQLRNANIPKEDLEAVLARLSPGLGTWAEVFYGSLGVRILTAWVQGKRRVGQRAEA